MADHATFAPSAAKRWMTCPGSHLPSLLIPRISSADADEGTRLHDVAAGCLTQRQDGTVEDVRFLRTYLDYCEKLKARATWYGVEQEVQHSEGLWGTADFLAVVAMDLHVVDLKSGRGVQIDPEENEQLLTYAVCALGDPKLAPKLGTLSAKSKVHLTIAQPTQDGPVEIRTWTTDMRRVMDHAVALNKAMEAAQKPGAAFVPGEHCRFCPVKPNCPELKGIGRAALAIPQTAGLAPRELSDWLDKADLLQQFIDALRETAHNAVTLGVVIPGYALKPKRATRQWSDEEKVAEIARAKRLRIFQPLKLMSPAMAEKAHGQKLPDSITEMIVSISSGTNLVKDASVKDEIPASAQVKREAFKKLTERMNAK